MMHHGNHTNVHGAGGGSGVTPHAGPPPGAGALHRHQMHQPIPHQPLPPHQLHNDSRHPMAHSQPSNMGSMGQSMGGMGTPMGVPPPHHGPSRPPHPIRPMGHHSMPPMKGVRHGYSMGGSYGPPAPYQQPPPPPPPAVHHPPPPPPGLSRPTSLPLSVNTSDNVAETSGEALAPEEAAGSAAEGAEGNSEATHPPLPAGLPTQLANSKEKTPMCLVNELARFNKIKHQYRLTSETGPAHKKIFTVTLRLGETEEYTAEGSSIKRAQHAAASAALTQTRHAFPPPKPHAHHATPHASARHTGAVMPTVELNALAMKLCQPAVYTAVGPAPPVPPPGARFPRFRPVYPPYHPPPHPHPHFPHPHPHQHPHPPYNQMGAGRGCGGVYRVRVAVGERSWAGEGATPQAARHDAAARALHDLRDRLPPDAASAAASASPTAQPAAAAATAALQPAADGGGAESGGEHLSLDVKSPVSLVHELALKRNLSVLFSVKSERGPPHMRVFVTTCTVGELETEGEGNGKKVSKKRAAERMLEEMRRSWPAALLRSGVTRLQQQQRLRRKQLLPKKKPRNLIKVFVTTCTVGELETEGEGNGKKVSKKRAAERMLEEVRRSWPAALLRSGVTRLQQQQRLRRKQLLPKKKPRNLIKENGETSAEATAESGDNPISRLAMARHAERARSPQYAVLEERGAPRKREFIVQCDAPPHSATGQGPNKKVAKRRAAHNVLLAMGLGSAAGSQTEAAVKNNGVSSEKIETKLRNEGEGGSVGGAGEVRQPVPGVLLMPDYSHRPTGQPSPPTNGISESAATGGTGAGEAEGSPGAKDQLLYLSQLLGFNVQFSDFPKRNHGEYLSLVALSTVPPIMCHGGGASTQQSHEQCSRAALRALAHMGLDTPSAHHTAQGVAGAGTKPSILSGGTED